MDDEPTRTARRVGDLATATGLTVRTLHHYETIGLLVASSRTPSGHRVYSDRDVARLYRISLLRRLGLPLTDIARALDDVEWSLSTAMATHLRELDQRLEVENRLRARLARMVASTAGDDFVHTDELLETLEEMTMLESTVQRRISILVYSDIEAAHGFLVDVFGLGAGEITRDGDGNAVHAEVEAGDGVLWLHPEAPDYGMSSPKTLGATTGSVAVMVDDVDAHFRHTSEKGAVIDYEPVDQPYGYREYSARDLEGAIWSFMKPLD